MKFHIRDIIKKTEEQIWQIKEDVDILFDDNIEININFERFHILWYYWQIFIPYPDPPILSKYIFDFFKSNTHLIMFEMLRWDIIAWYEKHQGLTFENSTIIEDNAEYSCYIGNMLYNAHCDRLGEYLVSFSLRDCIEISRHHLIKQAKKDYFDIVKACNYDHEITENAIQRCNSITVHLLFTDRKELMHNNIKKMCISGVLNKDQVAQIIGPRGYIKDVSGKLFPYPIDNGYLDGLTKTVDSFIESRCATEALMAQGDTLENSEYFNRRIQLSTTNIHSVVGHSCKNYGVFKHLVSENDLDYLKGKYYMEDGKPVLIMSIDNLIGTVVDIRTICKCSNEDPQTKCHICVGWANTIRPLRTNLGFHISIYLNEVITQSILSTKHLLKSIVQKLINLSSAELNWLKIGGNNKEKLYFVKDTKHRKYKMKFELKYAPKLINILDTNPEVIQPTQFTTIPVFEIGHIDNEDNFNGPIDTLYTNVNGVGVHLTKEALKYIRHHGWKKDGKILEVTFDHHWHVSDPIFLIPKLGDNPSQFLDEVVGLIDPDKKTGLKITDLKTVDVAINEFSQIIRSRIPGINLLQIESYICSAMVKDPDIGDWSLPIWDEINGTNYQFKSVKSVDFKRSLSGMFAFQEQFDEIMDIRWQNKKLPITKHILDDILY